MNRKALTIILLQALIIILMFWLLVLYGKDEYESYSRTEEDEAIVSPPKIATENGATLVILSAATQNQSGIMTSPLMAASFQSTLSSFGTVVGMEGYNELRTRYLSAVADADVVRASLTNSSQEYRRMLQLNRDNHNVSDRAVAAAEAAWKADTAKLAAADTAASSIRDTIRQQWGDTLASWATQQPAGESLQNLLSHRSVLLQVALPFDAAAPADHSSLTLEPTGTRGESIPANFVSASPQSDNAIQGKTYFYIATARSLRTGMRVTVNLPQQGKAASGVIVPASAVVWYGGKAWAYQKQGADRFMRRPIATEHEAGNGWFNSAGFKAGDEVVISGAQLLLSEEFKSQITNENED